MAIVAGRSKGRGSAYEEGGERSLHRAWSRNEKWTLSYGFFLLAGEGERVDNTSIFQVVSKSIDPFLYI